HLRVGEDERRALLACPSQRERARREDGDQARDRDGQDRQRDQHLDHSEAAFLGDPAVEPDGQQARHRSYFSCCQEPGTTAQVACGLPVVVVVAAPGAPLGGSTVVRSFAFPDIVARSAITGPLTFELADALNTPFTKETPSYVPEPVSEKPGLALPALIATISSRFVFGSKLPLHGLPEIGCAQIFAPAVIVTLPLT